MESTKINGMLMKSDIKNIKIYQKIANKAFIVHKHFLHKTNKNLSIKEKKIKNLHKGVFHLCHLMKTNLEMMSRFSIKLEDSTMSKRAIIRIYPVIHTKIDQIIS